MTLFTEFFASVPLFLPGLAVWLAITLMLVPRTARSLDAPRSVSFVLVLSLGFVLLATLTPTAAALGGSGPAAAVCDLARLGLPPASELLSVHDTLRNVLLFVPLGFALGLLRAGPRTAALILAAYLLPFIVEATQLVAPAIGRGCQSADVIDNAVGLTVGLVIGRGAAWSARRWAVRHGDSAQAE